MSFLSALGGALFGLGSNAINGMMSTAFSKELQENQGAVNYKYSEKSARNQPIWTRAGLESAGYNPMLAVSNATSGANSQWTSGNTMNPQDLSSSASNFIQNAQAQQRLENETHTAETGADLNEAQAQEARARATRQELENPFVSKRQEAEIGKLSAETANINRNTEYFEALEHNMQVMQRLQEMGINLDYRARIYGADKSYNASTYATNVDAETKRGTISTKNPFGLGGGTKYYAPDDVIRKPHYGNLRYYDTNDRKYWRNYY